MKKLTVKNYILTLLQLPVSLALLVVTYLEFLLTKRLALLDNYLSSPFVDLAAKRDISEVPAAAGDDSKTHVTKLGRLLNWLDSQDDVFIKGFCKRLETTGKGPDVTAGHYDRHLYAILRPNRAENMRRIRNVLYAIDRRILSELLDEVEIILDKLNK